MGENYPRYIDLTPIQAARLGRYLAQFNEAGRITIQQREDGKLLVTNPDSGQQWRIGVRGGC